MAQQVGRMARTYAGFRLSLHGNVARWTGPLQPSPMSETYRISVEYRLGSRPKVWILEPKLRCRKSQEGIPHTFSDGSICLHLQGEWSDATFVADAIIPWAALWLIHYEYWHATGEWQGGGHGERAA
jgi:hypothetical protein